MASISYINVITWTPLRSSPRAASRQTSSISGSGASFIMTLYFSPKQIARKENLYTWFWVGLKIKCLDLAKPCMYIYIYIYIYASWPPVSPRGASRRRESWSTL